MGDAISSGPSSPVSAVLAGYRPATKAEAADLARLRAVVATGDPWRRASPQHVTGSALIVHPPSGRVLLRWHDRQQAWLHVGGHAEPGETDPLAVALREGMEETGLTDLAPWPDGSLRHLVIVPVPAGRGEPAHEHIDLRFVLATSQPEAARPEHPGAALRWSTLAEARKLTAEANLRESLGRVAGLLDQTTEGT